MKRLALILAALLLAVAIALGIFLATFDADRYRPLVVSKLQEAIRRPVRLERISLGFRGGIALQLNGLALFEDAAAQGEPVIQVELASAVVRLAPLLRREVQISSLTLYRPRIHAARDAPGRINLLDFAPAPNPAAAGQAAGPSAGQSASPGQAPPASQASVSLDPSAPLGIVVSERSESNHDSARDTALPRTEGRARHEVSEVERAVSLNIASLRIDDGTIHWTDAASHPPIELWLRRLDVTVTNIAPGRPMDVALQGALSSERDNLSLSGRLTLPGAAQAGSMERLRFSLEGVPLESLIAETDTNDPHLRGTLSVMLEGGTQTLDPQQVTKALSGRGTLKLDEPRIANLNLLRAVFDKLSMLPGLVQSLEAKLPESYQAKLAATDTVLQPITLSMTLEQGMMQFDELAVQTDTFGLAGSGRVGLDGMVEMQSMLRIEPGFSDALIRSVNELAPLANARGELELPLRAHGRAPRITVAPNLQYVASKVLVTKAVDLLGQLLEREEPPPDEPVVGASPAEAPAASPPPEPGELLGQMLRRALEKN